MQSTFKNSTGILKLLVDETEILLLVSIGVKYLVG